MMNNKTDWATMLKSNTSLSEVIAAAHATPAKAAHATKEAPNQSRQRCFRQTLLLVVFVFNNFGVDHVFA
jgi:hypothetical protein